MSKTKSITLKDCNCLNCRLSRIEDQLNVMQHLIKSLELPMKSPKKTVKNSSKKSVKKS
jgi:hypothetical protein